MDKARDGRYGRLYDQLLPLMAKTGDAVSKMATIAAVLKHKISYFFWCGFYFRQEDHLLVGPYQGSVACLKLAKPAGVCWKALLDGETLIVGDVRTFPGHIACDSRSLSEIVVPVRDDSGRIYAAFDVDSDKTDSFDETDKLWLERIAADFLRLAPDRLGTAPLPLGAPSRHP